MRIAMVHDDWWPVSGGGPVHVKNLAIELAETFDDEVDIYTRSLREDGETYRCDETYASGEVRVIRQGPCTNYWAMHGRVASLFRPIPSLVRNDYDVVHGHTYLPAVPTRVGGILSRTPTVYTVHGTTLTSERQRNLTLERRLKKRLIETFVLGFEYDGVISVNKRNLDLLEENHSFVTYIPNGVDIGRFDRDESTVPGRILFLGRLAPQKRVRDLIDAFVRLASDVPNSELVIAGDGNEREELERYAAETTVSDRIEFTGLLSDEEVVEQYATAQLFVLPSVWEGHPLTLLEAWASELPVVTTDVTGIAEFVEHEKSGYLVEPKSPSALAAGIRYALKHETEALNWGKRGREIVKNEYTWQICAKRTREVYQQVTARDCGTSSETHRR